MTGIDTILPNHAATTKVLARIESLLNPIEQILRGEKPFNYPPALRTLMERMAADDLLIESVDSYLGRPDEIPSEALNALKGVTRIHPIPSVLRTRVENIQIATKDLNINNYKVCGWDPYYRQGFHERDPVGMAEEADAIILTRSDLHGLRQMLHILRAKLSRDPRTATTKLIIQDTLNNFWEPLLDHVGLAGLPGTVLADLDLSVTHFPGVNEVESPESTVYALRAMGARAHRHPASGKMDAHIKPGDRVYVCSGSPHKPIEIAKIFGTMHAPVDVLPLGQKIDVKPREADEDNHSLEGNNWQKYEETRKRVLADYDASVQSLCPPGRGPENTWFIFDDRAMGFKDPRIMLSRSFSTAQPLLNPYPHKLQPGAELASVFKNFSRKRMFQEMLPGALREIRDTTGEDANPAIIDTACYLLVRMDEMVKEEPQYISTFGTTRSIALTDPRPPISNASFTEYYSAPVTFNPEGTPYQHMVTKQQIPHYLETGSEMFLALRTLADVTEIRANVPDPSVEFGQAATPNRVDKLFLATQHTLFPDINGHGTSHMHRILKGALNGTYKFLNSRNSQYDITRFIKTPKRWADQERCGPAHRDRAEQALMTLARLYRDADAIVLTPDNPKLAAVPGIKWLKLLMSYSLMVGKQVDNRTIKPKFFGILDEDDGSWSEMKNIFDHLNSTPLLMNYYDHLVADSKSKGNLKKSLREHVAGYIRPEIIEKPQVLKPDSIEVPEDLYRVTIYCSASLGSETPAYSEALDFTEGLAARNFALIQGGGREGVMFATSEGIHRHIRKERAKNPSAQIRTHVASEQCHDTFEREGGWHDENHFARIHELIEQRMANLMNTDAEVLLAGGAGSIQEIAASLLMRAWGIMPTANRPLIIVNQLVDDCRAFDPLIKMFSQRELAQLNVYIVDNTKEALEILERQRAGLNQSLGGKAIHIPKAANDTEIYGPHPDRRLVANGPS